MADKSIHINEFEAHVEGMHHNFNAQFESRFKMLYSGHDMPVTVGTKREHKPKNRFANIVPYDSNRVKLVSYEDSGNDYVNASPVDGYKKRKRFIAAQAPLKVSVVDFWSVIWEERVTTIVMLTNIKEGEKLKCFQYWPETVGGEVEFKPFKLSLLEENRYSEYLIRKFNITKSGESFDVTQFHYVAWPDHGVPEYATGMLSFYRRIRDFHSTTKDPMLVHCSAGVGRTGTFIALDIVLRQVKNENVVDIHNVINRLRHQRPQMVQSLEQYIFIHDAVLEFITCGDTSIEAPNVMRAMAKLKSKDRMTGLTGYEQELKILNKVSPRAEDVVCPSANTFTNKNRPGHSLPVERCRVPLKQSYINASYADGYKQSRAYIIAQSPMANTIRDFWKMISDKQSATVIMLCELLENDEEVCACYWPRTGVNTFDDMDVELTGGNSAKHFTTRTMKITDNKTKKSHQVTQFQYHGWIAHKPPSNSTGLISMLEEVQKVQRSTANKPIVVHCSNGLGRSSTFCAIYTTLERFKAEQCVDIFQVVKSLRINRPGAVDSLGMYQFIFEVVLRYMQSFETYSNFSV
ncbi:receptor-type tyrosine-protein phosphatase alpha-like [Dysidea avara]|uniref:receptor-type tyrosine-protein phosphatase alpha-like n=1 Tax=Dysidea avara TaxID=196820 RepID=UPI00332E44BC